jgi:uncharacterized integral membrane protein
MNAKAFFKTVFLLAVLLLLVLIGLNNQQKVRFALPPILTHPVSLPAAVMFFAFFAVGWLTGTVLNSKAGGGSGKKSGGESKPAKK